MREARFYQNLRNHAPKGRVHLQRIETSTSAGVPDLNVKFLGGPEVWFELKAMTYPALRPAQAVWMLNRTTIGGRVFILNWHSKLGKIQGWDAAMLLGADWNYTLAKKTIRDDPHFVFTMPEFWCNFSTFVLCIPSTSVDTKIV